jgi:4-carboxymuconolactone decarboxylase
VGQEPKRSIPALRGVDPQLQCHVGISLNIGITASQLEQLADGVAQQVDADAGNCVRESLKRQLGSKAGK